MFKELLIVVIFTNATFGQLNNNLWVNQKFSKSNLQSEALQYNDFMHNEIDHNNKITFLDKNFFLPNSKVKFPRKLADTSQKDIKRKTNPFEKTEKTEDSDSLDFVFPGLSNKIPLNQDSKPNELVQDISRITFPDESDGNLNEKSRNPTKTKICEYTTRSQCHRRLGYIYETKISSIIDVRGAELICCMGAVSKKKEISRISYPNSVPSTRNKRSANLEETNLSLIQRNNILLRKYIYLNKNRISSSPSKTNLRIVTPYDDYEDPYLNIKNSIFKTTPQGPVRTTTESYDIQDYPDHYPVELPKPGFLGLHSDEGRKPTSWTFVNDRKCYDDEETVSDEDDGDPNFGYGSKTVDPRLVVKTTRRESTKLTSKSSDEESYDTSSQTISYHSNPDFKVLQGFKLLNLFRNRSRIFNENGEKTSHTSNNDRDSYQRPLSGTSTEDDNDFIDDGNSQVYNECGKAVHVLTDGYENGKQVRETVNGSHPWMAIIVLTSRPQTVLCYATILHPRLAITAADCVNRRTSPGDVTLIAGLWDLDNGSGSQQRKPSIHIHPKFRRGALGHNIAVLLWKRPLKLGMNVQPACLTEPKLKSDCKFFGWGGYDQEIHAQSHWQHASVLTTRQCNAELSSRNAKVELPANEFCATVDSQTSVTGVGGPLICDQAGRASVAGVAVWRDKVIVLISAREWVVKTFEALNA